MRLFLLAIIILFAGCIGQETAPAHQNQPPQIEAASSSENATAVPEVSGNLTVPSSEITHPPGNVTPPDGNQGGNATLPPSEPPQAPEQQTNTPPQGLAFANGRYVIALDDASVIPSSSEPCGIFSLWAINGSLIEKMFICPGESEIWMSPDGNRYRIEVVQVAAGYTGKGKWAKVIVFG